MRSNQIQKYYIGFVSCDMSSTQEMWQGFCDYQSNRLRVKKKEYIFWEKATYAFLEIEH